MRRSLPYVVAALLASSLSLAAGCSSDDEGPFGIVEDEQTIELGPAERIVTLRKGSATTTLVFPASALRAPQKVTLRLVSTRASGARKPLTATAVQIAPAGLV